MPLDRAAILAILKSKNISQGDFARDLKFDPGYLSRLLADGNPKLDTLQKLADGLGVSINKIVKPTERK